MKKELTIWKVTQKLHTLTTIGLIFVGGLTLSLIPMPFPHSYIGLGVMLTGLVFHFSYKWEYHPEGFKQ